MLTAAAPRRGAGVGVGVWTQQQQHILTHETNGEVLSSSFLRCLLDGFVFKAATRAPPRPLRRESRHPRSEVRVCKEKRAGWNETDGACEGRGDDEGKKRCVGTRHEKGSRGVKEAEMRRGGGQKPL